MNIHTPDIDRKPSREEAEAALRLLRKWAGKATDSEIAAVDPAAKALLDGAQATSYPELSRDYPADFVADSSYRATLPDLQNGPSSLIRGAQRQIQHVGISNFRLPVRYRTRDAGEVMLETSVTGTVSLEAEKKGINMSRIMRSFYAHAERAFSFEVIEQALEDYKRDLESFDARIQMRLSFPVKVPSLRSGLSGWQYYDIALELVDRGGERLGGHQSPVGGLVGAWRDCAAPRVCRMRTSRERHTARRSLTGAAQDSGRPRRSTARARPVGSCRLTWYSPGRLPSGAGGVS